MPFACTVGIPDPSRSVEHSVPWSLVCRDGRRLARVRGWVSDRSWGDAGDPPERVAEGRLRAVAELRGELADGDGARARARPRAQSCPTSVTRTTARPAASEAARSTCALMPQS